MTKDATVQPGIEIRPFRPYRFRLEKVGGMLADAAKAVTSPPYDIISPKEHEGFLGASPYNITRITLGLEPGGASSYQDRADLLRSWIRDGVLVTEAKPCLLAYVIDYSVPGSGGGAKRARFVGLLAIGELHAFDEGIVLPHERTFPKVVEDRLRLLEATRTNLESIFLLYSDPERRVDAVLAKHLKGMPIVEVEAKPGESHALYPIRDDADTRFLVDALRKQRPIIADGHHRYTTSVKYWQAQKSSRSPVPGCRWQLMTFANLYGEGLSILATHRLVTFKGDRPGSARSDRVRDAVKRLLSRMEDSRGGGAYDFTVETREERIPLRIPRALRESRRGVAATAYAFVEEVVLGDWLSADLDSSAGIRYHKEGTGETEALRSGEGDLLFRMEPVDRREFERVVAGGEVYPHKTTFFYPKLWSGLLVWPLEEPAAAGAS